MLQKAWLSVFAMGIFWDALPGCRRMYTTTKGMTVMAGRIIGHTRAACTRVWKRCEATYEKMTVATGPVNTSPYRSEMPAYGSRGKLTHLALKPGPEGSGDAAPGGSDPRTWGVTHPGSQSPGMERATPGGCLCHTKQSPIDGKAQ